jgi:hypothetical protein
MEDIGESLSGKIGPLPGYMWLVVAVGGVWGVYEWRKRAQPVSVGVAPMVDSGIVMPSAVGNAPGTNTSDGLQVAGAASTSPSTNASWAKMVADSLVASGSDPGVVTNALAKYMAGSQLSASETAVINTAVRQYGSPPNGVMPINGSVATGDSSGYTGHAYTVQSGDTIASILKKFYNEKPGSTAEMLATARISTGNGLQWNAKTNQYTLTPGQTLKLYQDSGVGVGSSTFHWTGG